LKSGRLINKKRNVQIFGGTQKYFGATQVKNTALEAEQFLVVH
jgi:hypothetical protein